MAKKAPPKTVTGPQLTAVTAEKVFGWKNVHQQDGVLIGKKQDKAGRWRKAKVPAYATDPIHAYAIEDRMKQLGRWDRYDKELCRITKHKTSRASGPPLNKEVEQRSKRSGSSANTRTNHEHDRNGRRRSCRTTHASRNPVVLRHRYDPRYSLYGICALSEGMKTILDQFGVSRPAWGDFSTGAPPRTAMPSGRWRAIYPCDCSLAKPC